jgi:hypothetical protein
MAGALQKLREDVKQHGVAVGHADAACFLLDDQGSDGDHKARHDIAHWAHATAPCTGSVGGIRCVSGLTVAHICAGTGLTPPTSAPGQGSPWGR